ncbi:MAG TPA: hypothetical protein VFO34_08230 [Candidatus Acidoferrales bacterium]|nr:hypothetical protein [Candidatus Acidoferrales bacterium]
MWRGRLWIVVAAAKAPKRPLWRLVAEYAVTISAALLAGYLILLVKL